MEMVLSVAALAISLLALSSSLFSNLYERRTYIEQVYQRFAQMWYDMDQIFIQYPYMRKYFYRNSQTGGYEVLAPEHEHFDLGICIAEMFCDVFQYSAPLEDYLSKEDRESYVDYKAMIMASPIVQITQEKNDWHTEQ